MDKKVKSLLNKLNKIESLIINNLNENNIEEFNLMVKEFEKNINSIVSSEVKKLKSKQKDPIWTKFPNMTEDEIRDEFMNVKKYPNIKSIKEAIKGYVDMQKISNVKTRATLINHILERYNKGKFIAKIG